MNKQNKDTVCREPYMCETIESITKEILCRHRHKPTATSTAVECSKICPQVCLMYQSIMYDTHLKENIKRKRKREMREKERCKNVKVIN